MRCIQFTDPHIGMPGDDTFDVDVRTNFRRILSAIAEEKADYVVLTGDLCFREPRQEIYDWVYDAIAESGLKIHLIPGNHDDQDMMGSTFGLSIRETGEIYYSKNLGGHQCMFLDTGVGQMSDAQWSWFLEQSDKASGPLIVFMHHPPAFCDVPYMDRKHGFMQNARFQARILSLKVPVHVFCGHYHVDRSVSIANMHVHITPSCFFQINSRNTEFEVDHKRIGYRRIFLADSSVISSVVYLD
ncbi:MAG: metallophosphoesterase [Saprospiraceae bacterium]|nr:metallophosphoesterase [Saprospiraceae bacterium]